MIDDASIAAALLWPEMASLAAIYGPATPDAVWSVDIAPWKLTAHTAAQCVAIAHSGHFAGMLGPGETTNLPPDLARQLRRAIHEHVYQHHRAAKLAKQEPTP